MSDKDYFINTQKLHEGEFWHSKLDLNLDNGKQGKTYVPTFRIALPIYYKNEFRGIIISNINIQKMLEDIINSPDFEIYIYDSDGEILIAPNPEYSWSRYKKTHVGILQPIP